MTKANLIDQIAERMQRSKKESEQVIDAVLSTVTDALANGEKVDLRGFGSFQISDKKERQGRNPKTGEPLTIAARRVAVFKPSKELAERVSGSMGVNGASAAESSHEEPSSELSDGSAKLHGDKINM